jgi:hypothetical protein
MRILAFLTVIIAAPASARSAEEALRMIALHVGPAPSQ